MPQKTAKGKKDKSPSKGKPVKAAPVKESSESEDDSSDEDSSEEEEMAVDTAKPANKGSNVALKRKPSDDDDDDSDDSSDEEEAKIPVKKAKLTKPSPKSTPKPAPAPVAMDEDDSDDSDSSEEEETPVIVEKKSKSKVPAPATANDDDSDSDDSDDSDEDDEDDSEEEEEKPAATKKKDKEMKKVKVDVVPESGKKDPAPKEKKQKKTEKQKKKIKPADDWDVDSKESDDDDDEEDDDESDEDDSEEEEEKPAAKKKKDKKLKNGKVDDDVPESGTLFIGNIPRECEEKKLKKFFEKRGIPIAEIRRSKPGKPFAYVDVANLADMKKALALNGEELGENKLKIEKATPKPTQTPKKEDKFKGNKEKIQDRQDKRKSFEQQDLRTLFVKNLPESATEDSIKEFFPDAEEVRLPRKPDNSHRGIAYIVLENKDKVEEIMNEKQGADFDGSALYLDFCGKKSKFQSPGGFGGGGGGDRKKSIHCYL